MEVPCQKSSQTWPGYYLGEGIYALQYAPKQAETLTFHFTSPVPGFRESDRQLVVSTLWPGKANPTDYPLGKNWYSDRSDPALFDGKLQGGKTIQRWRNGILPDWTGRWKWLKE